MSDFYLDLKDKPAVIDFFVDHLDYAPPVARTAAEKIIKQYEDGAKLPTDRLAEAVRQYARAVYPARFAVKRFFGHEGKEEEWQAILAAVRPSTAHLLKRFRAGVKAESLDDVLRHAESEIALRNEERLEISMVRKQLHHSYWRDHDKALARMFKDGELELKSYLERFSRLRELAMELPRNLQDEAVSKLARFEDRVFFECELVPLEIIDEEVKYYIEQKELAPDESQGGTV
jgi:hypothetical protein